MGEDTTVVSPNQSIAAVRIIARDTVNLHANYRDPFQYQKQVRPIASGSFSNTEVQPRRSLQSRPKPPTFVWPKVTYHGLIRNRNSQKPLALIRVDGLVYNLRKGEEIFNGIIVKNITSDLVTLKSGKHEVDVAIN